MQRSSKIIFTNSIVYIIVHIILENGVGANVRSMFTFFLTGRKSPICWPKYLLFFKLVHH